MPTNTEHITIAPFGTEHTSAKPIPVGCVSIETNSGNRISISVLIIPFIAAPLQNSLQAPIESFPHLHGLKLAYPITNENNFQISVLIGADYYWTFVEDKIVRGDGPTAQQSKLGFLLSGPLSHPVSQYNTTASLHVATMTIATTEEPNLDRFWSVEEARFWSVEEASTTQTCPQRQDITFIQHYQATDDTYIQPSFQGNQIILNFCPI